jgi:hypothetical protein
MMNGRAECTAVPNCAPDACGKHSWAEVARGLKTQYLLGIQVSAASRIGKSAVGLHR